MTEKQPEIKFKIVGNDVYATEGKEMYKIHLTPPTCTCEEYQWSRRVHGSFCRHIRAARSIAVKYMRENGYRTTW